MHLFVAVITFDRQTQEVTYCFGSDHCGSPKFALILFSKNFSNPNPVDCFSVLLAINDFGSVAESAVQIRKKHKRKHQKVSKTGAIWTRKKEFLFVVHQMKRSPSFKTRIFRTRQVFRQHQKLQM